MMNSGNSTHRPRAIDPKAFRNQATGIGQSCGASAVPPPPPKASTSRRPWRAWPRAIFSSRHTSDLTMPHYTFSVRGADKASTVAAAATKFDEMRVEYPTLAAETDVAQLVAKASVQRLPDDTSKDVTNYVNVNVLTVGGVADGAATGVVFSISAELVER